VVLNGVMSSWLYVKSAVSQESVFGSVLFLIYVNDIDDGLFCKISKFADETKIASKVTMTPGRKTLQSYLDRLACWVSKWQSIIHPKQQRSRSVFNEWPTIFCSE